MDRRYGIWLVVRGVVAIVFGLLAVVWPGLTLVALALLFGAYALVDGVGKLIEAYRGRPGGHRTGHVLAGLFGVTAGVLSLAWPGVTALVLVVLIGIWAVVTGVMDILAATLRHGDWLLAVVGVLSLVAGVLILVRPGVGAIAIGQVIGFYAIISGVLILMEMWREHRSPGVTPAV